MIKLFSVWMISSLVSVNRQALVESQPKHVLKEVTLYTYVVDGYNLQTESITYDSLIISLDTSRHVTMFYYLDGTAHNSYVLDMPALDTLQPGTSTRTPFQYNAEWYETVTIDSICFPLYTSVFSTCPDPQCSIHHGHIQHTSRSWFSIEFGHLISTVATAGRNIHVTVLMGYKNNPRAGQVVNQLIQTYFKTDVFLLQKYQADFDAYYSN